MTPPSIALCGACGHEIARGALRCKSCDAPFDGPRQEPRIDAAAEALAAGMMLSLKRTPAPGAKTTLLKIMAAGQRGTEGKLLAVIEAYRPQIHPGRVPFNGVVVVPIGDLRFSLFLDDGEFDHIDAVHDESGSLVADFDTLNEDVNQRLTRRIAAEIEELE